MNGRTEGKRTTVDSDARMGVCVHQTNTHTLSGYTHTKTLTHTHAATYIHNVYTHTTRG